MKKSIIFISGFLGLFITLIILLKSCGDEIFEFDPQNYLCSAYEEDKNLSFKGIIDSIYLDLGNHNAKIIEIRTGNESKPFYIEYDRSGLFEFSQKGDSIIKKSESYVIVIIRNDVVTSFNLDYGCL